MTDFKDRLNEALNLRDMTAAELSRIAGVNEGAISSYRAGAYKASQRSLEKIANALHVSIPWLMGKDVPMEDELPDSYPVGKLSAISVIGSVRAGIGGIAQEEYLGAEFADADPEEHRFFMVKGDSMSPQISEGDLALVHKQDDVESGELAVVIVNGEEGLIKKVLKHEGAITLVSFNQAYPPRVFVGKEMNEVKIWGKVKQTMHRW